MPPLDTYFNILKGLQVSLQLEMQKYLSKTFH